MLSPERKKQMRSIGHSLKPVVIVGDQGASLGLLKELRRALTDHELIKVKIRAKRTDRDRIIESLCSGTGAECIQSIGSTVLLFLAAENPKPWLSNLMRPA